MQIQMKLDTHLKLNIPFSGCKHCSLDTMMFESFTEAVTFEFIKRSQRNTMFEYTCTKCALRL